MVEDGRKEFQFSDLVATIFLNYTAKSYNKKIKRTPNDKTLSTQ